MKSDLILPVVLTGLLAQLTTALTVITKVPRKRTTGSLQNLRVSMEHYLSWLSCFSGFWICFIDPRVRKIKNEASNCPGIFSRTPRFYDVDSCSPGSPLPRHFSEIFHSRISSSCSWPIRSCRKCVNYSSMSRAVWIFHFWLESPSGTMMRARRTKRMSRDLVSR